MRKNKLYKSINIVLILMYLVIIAIQYKFPLFDISLSIYWFMLLCLAVGISMMFKAFIFSSDSSLWLSVLLISVFITMLVFNIFSLDIARFWPIVLTVVSISCIVTGLVFKEIYQVKLFFLFTYFSIPFYLLSFGVIKIWVFILLIIATLAISFITFALLPERWYSKNTKKRM